LISIKLATTALQHQCEVLDQLREDVRYSSGTQNFTRGMRSTESNANILSTKTTLSERADCQTGAQP